MMKQTRLLCLALLIALLSTQAPTVAISGVSCDEAGLIGAIEVGGEISLAENCHYSLSADLPVINTDTTFNGNGATIDGSNAYRILSVSGSHNLSLNHLTIANGKGVYGSGLFVESGNVNITDSMFIGNSARFGGGAVYVGSGNLTITNSIFDTNSAGNGGGVAVTAGTVTLADSTFANNVAGLRGGGGVWMRDGEMSITNSEFSNNVAGSRGGGGVYVVNGTATIALSRFFDNASISGDGGGVNLAKSGTISIMNTTFSGNNARNGGAVFTSTDATIANSSFVANTASNTGGGAQGSLTITNSTYSGNRAAQGGGIAANQATITSSTFTANTASDSGGAIFAAWSLVLKQSIVSENEARIGADVYVSEGGTFDSRGYNLIGSDNGGELSLGRSNILTLEHGLEGLSEQVYLLSTSSPALDAIPPDLCATSSDQRGMPRPQGLGCDIGAVEMEGVVATGQSVEIGTVQPPPTSEPTAVVEVVPCSEAALRAAIIGGGSIELQADCTYPITTDFPAITQDLTIHGNHTLLDGSGGRRLFALPEGVRLTLDDLTIEGELSEEIPWQITYIDYALSGAFEDISSQSTVITPANSTQVTELARYGTGKVLSAVLSPSTNTLAVLMSTGIRLFDMSDLSAEPRIMEISSFIDGIMFSPDGSLLLGTGDRSGRVHVWDTVTLNEEAVLDAEIYFRSLDRVVFSSDGQTLVTGGRESIRLWNTENWKLLTTLHDAAFPNIVTMAVSPDATKIATRAADENYHVRIAVWDSISGSIELSLEDETVFQINSMAINSRNDLLAFTVDNNDAMVLKVVDIQSGNTLITTEGDGALLFSPDNQYLLANRFDETFSLNIETKQSIRFPGDIEGDYVGQLKDALFLGDALVMANDNGALYRWDMASSEVSIVFQYPESEVWRVARHDDGSLMAVVIAGNQHDGDHSVFVWEDGQLTPILDAAYERFEVVTFSPDTNQLFAGSTGSITSSAMTLWDVNGDQFNQLWKYPYWTEGAAFSPDGVFLATADLGDNYDISLRDVTMGRELLALPALEDTIYDVAFSPNGAILASVDRDGIVRLWDVADGELLANLTGHTGHCLAVAYSPNGSRIASACADNTVRLWDSEQLEVVEVLGPHDSYASAVAFNPDGSILASGSSGGEIRLWDSTMGKPLAVLEGHTANLWGLAFSPDGRLLASGSFDSRIIIWDVATLQPLVVLDNHADQVTSVTFNSSGTRLASGSADGTVRLWGIPSE